MTDLITTDEVLIDDIVGLLDFAGSLTPRPSEGDPDSFTTLFLSQSTGSNSPSSSSDDNNNINNIDDNNNTPDRHRNRREKEKTRQRRYRQQLKDSRDELQRQVGVLTKELQQLSKNATQRRKSNELLRTSSRWVSKAVQERAQRTASEAEQKRLIAAVNHQASYIKGLRKVVGNQLGSSRVDCPALHLMTGALYTTYLQQLESCYARADSVMTCCGMTSLPETTFNSTHRRETDGEVAYFQHVNKVALPYSFDQTCNALWKAVHEKSEPACGGYEMAPHGDVFIKSRVLQTDLGNLAQRYISRWYKEENRVVLVWKLSSEGEGAFSGLHAEETAWLCIRQTPTGVMMEVYAQQVPMRFNLTESHEPAMEKFHEALHKSLEADKLEMSKCMARLLLDDVLTGIEC